MSGTARRAARGMCADLSCVTSCQTSTGRRSFTTSARQAEEKDSTKTEQPLSYAAAPQSPHSYTPTHPAIPSYPTWSIHSLLHAAGLHDEATLEKSVSTEQMLKLHRLSALDPPSTQEEMDALKESLRESMRFVDLVRDGEIHPRVDYDNGSSSSSSSSTQGVFHEVQSESARVIDWEHEHGKDGSLGAFFAEAYHPEGAQADADVAQEHFGLSPAEREGTEVLDKQELLSRARTTKGGYFYVKRGGSQAQE